MPHLDPRGPLVVDTRELGRRPGTMLRRSLTVPAPADLGIDVIGVPEGSPIELEFRLESVVEGVLVSGTARVQAHGECVRCLEPLHQTVETEFQELYVHAEGESPVADEDADEEGTSRLEGDLLDLEPVLRDAVVLDLPLQPVCSEDCPGLCAECGALGSLALEPPAHAHGTAVPLPPVTGGRDGGERGERGDRTTPPDAEIIAPEKTDAVPHESPEAPRS